jgi:uncharacterized protein
MTAAAIAFPYDVNRAGRTATVSDADTHIRQMLEQVLFTNPGERVNRPDFGCGLLALTFEPNSELLAAGLQVSVGTSIQQWLGDLIELTGLEVSVDESTLSITIAYTVRATGAAKVESFSIGGAP